MKPKKQSKSVFIEKLQTKLYHLKRMEEISRSKGSNIYLPEMPEDVERLIKIEEDIQTTEY